MLDQKLSNLGKVLKIEKHVVIITDTTVKRLYGKRFPQGDVIVIKEGENIKDMGTIYYVFKKMLEQPECVAKPVRFRSGCAQLLVF